MALEMGTHVQYMPEARPNLVCPGCETTSEELGETATLEGWRGRIGTITRIMDPRHPDIIRCRKCRSPFGESDHFRAMGIGVEWEDWKPGEMSGVWAFPSELTEVSQEDFDKAFPPEKALSKKQIREAASRSRAKKKVRRSKARPLGLHL